MSFWAIIKFLLLVIIVAYLLKVALDNMFGKGYTLEIIRICRKSIVTSFEEKNLAYMALITLWISSGMTVFLVVFCLSLMPDVKQTSINPLQLFGALAILLSALMASVSVLLNIKKTRELKILELRKEMFEEIASFITHISLSGEQPTPEVVADLAKKTRTAKYFFDEEIDAYIDEIINKSSSVNFLEQNHYEWFQNQRVSQMDAKFKHFFR